jgi:hypothetical protein
VDEQRTTGEDEAQSQEDIEQAEERDRLKDLEMKDEEGQSIKGGVPKTPDAPEN